MQGRDCTRWRLDRGLNRVDRPSARRIDSREEVSMPGFLFSRLGRRLSVALGAVALHMAVLLAEEAEARTKAALHVFARQSRPPIVVATLIVARRLHHRVDALHQL